jgi:hypothetical protein
MEPDGSVDVVKAFHEGVEQFIAGLGLSALPGCQEAIKGLVSSLEVRACA